MLDSRVHATGGTLTLDRLDDGIGAHGSYDITFESGDHVKGAFDATWCHVVSDKLQTGELP